MKREFGDTPVLLAFFFLLLSMFWKHFFFLKCFHQDLRKLLFQTQDLVSLPTLESSDRRRDAKQSVSPKIVFNFLNDVPGKR